MEALRTETKSFSSSISERIDITVAALHESDARQATDLVALQIETRESSRSASERIESLSADVGVQQEDIAAVKTTLGTIYSRIDALVERLDRQGDALRLMQPTYSQRETELEQLVDGLVRLRAFPKPQPASGL